MNVIGIINQALETKSQKAPRRKRSYFNISDAGKTPYEIYKKLLNEEEISPRLRRIFDNGHAVHERLIRYLKEQGLIKGTEIKIKARLFHGRADAIIELNGKPVVLEIKSMNKKYFDKLKKYCHKTAFFQIQLYLHYLKIDDGIILVECKDDQRLKQFFIKRKPRTIEELIKKFSRLKNIFIKAGVMLPK